MKNASLHHGDLTKKKKNKAIKKIEKFNKI